MDTIYTPTCTGTHPTHALSAGHVVHKAAEDLLKLWAEQWEARRVGVLWEAAQAAAAVGVRRGAGATGC